MRMAATKANGQRTAGTQMRCRRDASIDSKHEYTFYRVATKANEEKAQSSRGVLRQKHRFETTVWTRTGFVGRLRCSIGENAHVERLALGVPKSRS